MTTLPIVVVGAGAAGLMAAINAANPDRPTLLLETTRDGGRKILISGGGRCNILPSALDPAVYVTESSRNSMRKMLLSWPLAEQQRWFDDVLGLDLTLEPETGKLFPASNRARDVRDGLVRFASTNGVEIQFGVTVVDLEPGPDKTWRVSLHHGETIAAAAVIVATGGLSVPATGSDGRGLAILRRLGHVIHDTYPALTPLTAEPPIHAPLAGVSLDVTIEAPLERGRFSTRGGFLFTHRGYSGPSALNVSHLAVRARMAARLQPLLVAWTPMDANAWDATLRDADTGEVGPLLRRHLPQRLAETLLLEAGVDGTRRLSQLLRDERSRLVAVLARYELPWAGDEGYKKAEVTGGGVALDQVKAGTLESRHHPGLFICGEALDAFGPIGGYNFAWAWATGRTAGLGARAIQG
jgi:predicted Rossmann fold flavoprotein